MPESLEPPHPAPSCQSKTGNLAEFKEVLVIVSAEVQIQTQVSAWVSVVVAAPAAVRIPGI